MKLLLTFITTLLLVLSTGCDSRDDSAKESSPAAGGMKCGAGKCGANMFDGNAALVKKKANISKQMREDDPRRSCVAQAASTKEVYDCVRDPETGKMSKRCGVGKCGQAMKASSSSVSMKCGVGKCGNAMKESSPTPTMKCGAGKCGSDMAKPEPKKAPAMKCGAGKCGASM